MFLSLTQENNMTNGKTLRLRRFFRHKRAVIIPMDHPMYGGPVEGLEDPFKAIRTFARTEADGVLLSPWVMNRCAQDFGQLAVAARLDGGNSSLGQRVDEACNVLSVEQALRFGAEMIAINVFVGGENEPAMLRKLGDTAEVCEQWGVPLLAEMIPATALEHHYGRKEAKADNTGNPVAVASRIGAEYGGDVIKTIYSGNPADFAYVIQTTTVPIVVAGGPKTGSDAEFLAMVKTCMEAGAAGITMGRNVWQRQRVEGMIAALCAIVHDDASVEDALRLL
jgi:fructose-bisphosphate aldolase/2-amino-3,7-dideoxy-D-threo-hept-6-ulosonate synthase